jgi:uncharacterized membrane protein
MNRNDWDDQRLEIDIAQLLRTGVVVAAGLVAAGGFLYLARHGGEHLDRRVFHGEPSDLRSIGGVLRGVGALQGLDIIQLGLLVLIATPIARVALALYAFARQGDRTYVVITLIVLSLLLYSLTIGRF